MSIKGGEIDRRSFMAAGAGAGIAHSASAAQLTTDEEANVQLVNEFCAAWPDHDLDNIMGFLLTTGRTE